MDLCITRVEIQLGNRDEQRGSDYIPTMGDMVLRPDLENPGKWLVSFRPRTSEIETTLDLHSADKAVEHLANLKNLMVGIQQVLENPGK